MDLNPPFPPPLVPNIDIYSPPHSFATLFLGLHLMTPGLRGVAEPHFLHCTPIHALSVRYLGGVHTTAPGSWRGKEHLEIKDGIVVFQVMYLREAIHSVEFLSPEPKENSSMGLSYPSLQSMGWEKCSGGSVWKCGACDRNTRL